MRFGILGPTQVFLADGRPVAVGGSRLRALLALLLVEAGRVVPAERLIDGLYGASPPSGAANALQSQVSRLRQALPEEEDGPHPLVEFHQRGYRLAVDPEQVDVHRFTQLAEAGHRALAAGDRPHAAALLREALELWRGRPLADLTDTPSGRAHTARLDEVRLVAIEDRVEAELGLGGHGPLVGELRELVAEYPVRERLRGQLMRALYAGGRQTEALATFEDARRTLAEELGVDPSTELAAVHVAVLRADESLLPRQAARQGLPGQLSSFVGREEELRRVGKLLGEARLVTLSGPGGAGKTRLAIEAAGRQAGDVSFVELAPLTAGANVPQAVLSALGLRDAGLRAPAEHRQDTTDRLVAALADRQLLLVLDNCEHVVADTARLAARLLSACPRLRILTTSREPLRLTGEALCPVSGLALPPTDSTPASAREYPAVRLFTDRAADVAPDFAITPANVDAVLRICRTLDGLPLAIELAAARLRALPVADIAARLDDRFRLLSRGSRTAQPRHQTLRAAVEWSWDLLDETEQLLARRLTVFAGGATLEAAERVCGRPGYDVVEVLTSLTDKSLIEVGDGRYRMLDTVRAFCAERLAEAGETERLRRAHAAYFLDLAQTADPHLRRAEQLEWLRRLDADRDNLHAALRRAMLATDTTTALRLVTALSFYWWLRGLRSEGAALAGELCTMLGTEPPPGLDEEYALCMLNASLGGFGDLAQHGYLSSAQSLLLALGQPPRQPFLLYLSGMASGPPADDPDDIVALYGPQQQVLGPDPWVHALVWIGMGMTRLLDGQFEQAETELTRALQGFRALGERWGTMLALASITEIGIERDGQAVSLAPMDEAMRLAEELGSTVDSADMLRSRGDGRLATGDLVDAYADYHRASQLARQAGAPEVLAAALLGLARVAWLRGDLAEARRLCDAALAENPNDWFGTTWTRLGIIVLLGRIAEATGDVDAARAGYRQALTATLGFRGRLTLTDAVEGLVRLELASGGGEQAALLLGAINTLLLPDATEAGAVAVARVGAATKAQVGAAVYEPAFSRGAAMTHEQALSVISGR
jgi:predicted ATPase/DNA-binding SARP family transcriptional activator